MEELADLVSREYGIKKEEVLEDVQMVVETLCKGACCRLRSKAVSRKHTGRMGSMVSQRKGKKNGKVDF